MIAPIITTMARNSFPARLLVVPKNSAASNMMAIEMNTKALSPEYR